MGHVHHVHRRDHHHARVVGRLRVRARPRAGHRAHRHPRGRHPREPPSVAGTRQDDQRLPLHPLHHPAGCPAARVARHNGHGHRCARRHRPARGGRHPVLRPPGRGLARRGRSRSRRGRRGHGLLARRHHLACVPARVHLVARPRDHRHPHQPARPHRHGRRRGRRRPGQLRHPVRQGPQPARCDLRDRGRARGDGLHHPDRG